MLIFKQNLSTINEVKFRARDDVFWIRLTISILVGYLFSVAWAFMSFAIFLRIVVIFEDLFNTYSESGAKFDAMNHFISLISSPIIGLFMAIFAATPMLLSFVATLPIAITMGLCLRTSRNFVMLCSSLTGSLIGLPILLLSTGMIGNTNRHMDFQPDIRSYTVFIIIFVLPSFISGSVFGECLWRFCIMRSMNDWDNRHSPKINTKQYPHTKVES